jgi:type II secretory pathway pseudopilin PulG
MQQYTGSGY